MSISRKTWRRLGISLAIVIVAAFVVRTWVVPGLILRQLRNRYGGEVAFRSWWVNGTSAGVSGLTLHEGTAAGSPVWLEVGRVQTDLSLPGLLSGRFSPGRITLVEPSLAYGLDASGKPLTAIPWKSQADSSGAIPEIIVQQGKLKISQQGRPDLIVSRIDARLTPKPEGSSELSGDAEDPVWGRWDLKGRLDSSGRSGRFDLTAKAITVDPELVRRVPVVPVEVWDNADPNGPIDVGVTFTFDSGKLSTEAVLTLRETQVALKGLDVTTRKTTGEVRYDGNGVVALSSIGGDALGGRVELNGNLDFTDATPRFKLDLGLEKVEVADAPKTWQLDEIGISKGRLTGKADLHIALTKDGVDLTGSSGEAVVEGGNPLGILTKSMKIGMKAEGDDLQFKSGPTDKAASVGAILNRLFVVGFQAANSVPKGNPSPAPSSTGRDGREKKEPSSKVAPSAGSRPGVVAPAAKDPKPQDPQKKSVFRLPKTVSTEIEFEDVDLKDVIERAKLLKIILPVEIAGKLSLKAQATIPVGTIREIDRYAFHGQAILKGASIDGVDLGRLSAKLDLDKGVVELTDFRGRLVDKPEGSAENPPEPTEQVPLKGPLPHGGFRGRVRAELSPPGALKASFEGDQLPLGELAAPAFPRPTPLSGRITFQAEAEGRVGGLADPKAWSITGTLSSDRVTYRGSTLDALSTTFDLKEGRIKLPDLAASLSGKPLSAKLDAELAPPYAFDGALNVAGWNIADVLAFVPRVANPTTVSGLVTVEADASGTLTPWKLTTKGQGSLGKLTAGTVHVGDVPFRWETVKDSIRLDVTDSHAFGGRVSAEVVTPAEGEGETKGTIQIKQIDTADLTALVPGEALKMSGKADGRVGFTVEGADSIRADVKLQAPELTIQGLDAKAVTADVWVRKGKVLYEVLAESLGGKVKFKGDVPLGGDPANAEANAELRAVGFGLSGLGKILGPNVSLGRLQGIGAIDANLRTPLASPKLSARARVEVRDLKWGEHYPLGHLKGIVSRTPKTWRIDPFSGVLLGGNAEGTAWGETTAEGASHTGFSVRVDRADLKRILAFLPSLAHRSEGYGTLRLAGRLDKGAQADGEVVVNRARFSGVPLSELRAPVELTLAPAAGMFQVRRWSARAAGGLVRGNAAFHLGPSHAYQGDLQLTDLDIESLARLSGDVRRPASGKVSGRISWSGHDLHKLKSLKGKIDLDLADASLVELPVFREIDRLLGAVRGGVFEVGDLTATVADGRISVEQMTLYGRLVQIHGAGTVGFDGRLDLDVLVNTNQLIPQTGQALAAAIPGLRSAVGRQGAAAERVSSFLSAKLLKLKVTGTIQNPTVNVDPTVIVKQGAVGFFADALKLPPGIVK